MLEVCCLDCKVKSYYTDLAGKPTNMDTNISIPKKKIYNKKKIASDLDGVIDENKQLKEIEADEQ